MVLKSGRCIHDSASSRLPTLASDEFNIVKYVSGDRLIYLPKGESRYYFFVTFFFIINITRGCLRLKETVELSQ